MRIPGVGGPRTRARPGAEDYRRELAEREAALGLWVGPGAAPEAAPPAAPPVDGAEASRLAALEAAMRAAFAAWELAEAMAWAAAGKTQADRALEQAAPLTPPERDGAFAYREALDAYARAMPPVRDLPPSDITAAIVGAGARGGGR